MAWLLRKLAAFLGPSTIDDDMVNGLILAMEEEAARLGVDGCA